MKEEVLSAYQQIRALSGQLRRREKLQQRKRQQQQQHQQQQQQQQQQNMEEEEDEEADEDENEANCASSSSSSDEATTVASVKPGILKACVQVIKTFFLFLVYIFVGKYCMFDFKKFQELRGLLHDLLRKESKGACISCGGDSNERLRLEVKCCEIKFIFF